MHNSICAIKKVYLIKIKRKMCYKQVYLIKIKIKKNIKKKEMKSKVKKIKTKQMQSTWKRVKNKGSAGQLRT